MAIPALAGLTLQVDIIKGRDLIAKDRNLMGKRTTSDPYVKVFISKPGHSLRLIGKTKIIKKNCSPTWNDTVRLSMGADEATAMLSSNPTQFHMLQLQIYDHDKVGDDDFMGLVTVPIDPLKQSSADWYTVQKGSPSNPNLYCRNAKGEIQVSVSVVGRQMRDMGRGTQKHLQHSNITVGLAWDVEYGQRVDLDSSVVAIDQYGNVNMDETVYYGNLSNPNNSLVHSGDETTGYAEGDDERIHVQLDRIPRHIVALYFLLTVATPGKTLAQVRSAQVRFISTTTKEGICRIVPHKFGNNTALFLVRIAQSPSGGWVLTPIEEGSEYAMDFGSLIPELKGYTRDLIPSLYIDPTERIAVMRKGGTIRITDYLPRNRLPERVTFGLAWDVTNGKNIDLDASAILLNERFEKVDVVFFRKLTSSDGSVQHSGDEREGDEVGDDEKIQIQLGRVRPDVKYIGFVVNSYSGEELDDVSKASCHLFDPVSNIEIAKYTLTNSKELDKHTALLMGCLYRSDTDNGAWHLSIISQPKQGKTAMQNIGDLVGFLRNRQPSMILHPPTAGEDEEIDLSVMPTDLVNVDDEEIVVVPQDDLVSYVPPPQQATVVVQATPYRG